VLVGETRDAYCADYRSALREYVSRAGLGDRVRIEPVTDDPYSWHAVADLLVCASDVESLPRAILEAMAFRTPVLSTRVYGVPEVIADGRNGYLCDTRDVEDLARGLDRVLGAGAEELSGVTAAAARHVPAHHDASAYTATMAQLIRGLVADPEALPAHVLTAPESVPAPGIAVDVE
jgi:glycosyltransferase involved in cell wall biosynthesis